MQRWIIGLIFIFMVCMLISNVIEQASPVSTREMTLLDAAVGFTTVEVNDPYTGIGAVVQAGLGVIEAIWNALWFNYSFWYNTEAGYTEANCEAGGGRYLDSGLCQFPNGFMVIRYVLFWPMTIGFLFALAMALRSVIAS